MEPCTITWAQTRARPTATARDKLWGSLYGIAKYRQGCHNSKRNRARDSLGDLEIIKKSNFVLVPYFHVICLDFWVFRLVFAVMTSLFIENLSALNDY